LVKDKYATLAKFQVMFLGRFKPLLTFRIGNISIKVENKVKRLGIHIDDKLLRFTFHVEKNVNKWRTKLALFNAFAHLLLLKLKSRCVMHISFQAITTVH